MKRVVIFAEYDDLHGLTVARRLVDHGAEPVFVNTATLGSDWRANFELDADGAGFSLAKDSLVIRFEELSGAWLRRTPPIKGNPDVTEPEIRRFCVDEHVELLLGVTYQLKNVINSPTADRAANRKPLQLAVAHEVGFNVPRTLISNDPDRIKEFASQCTGGVIFKILSNTRFQFTETRVFDETHLPLIEAAKFAPTIFQERITPREHLRVTVVDDELFVAAIRTDRPETIWDWRLDRGSTVAPGTLRAEDADRVRAMQERFGLRYGALDFIIDKEGDAWFLENNPGGQFLFAEMHANLPISDAIARCLMKVDKPTSSHLA